MKNYPPYPVFKGRFIRIAGVMVLVMAAGLWLARQPLQTMLFNITGEETLLPQISGAIQYGLTRLQPPLRTADNVPVQYAGVNSYGVNTFLQTEVEPAKREKAMRLIAEAGIKWVRQEFPWEDIEIHGKGDFEDRRNTPYRSAWEKYDQMVNLAEKYNLKLMVRLSNPPEWTRALTATVGTFAPPDNLRDYGDFVEAVARRYKGRIAAYQIWNEPNIYPEWGEYPISAEAYTALLKEGYTRIKTVDAEAIVVMGALASTIELDRVRRYDANGWPTSPGGLSDVLFLQQMYDAGAAPYFDVLAMQGYGLWSGPTDRRMQPRVMNFSRPLYIRDVMVRNGDSHKPIWLSELGWNAVPPASGIPPVYGQVTLEQQGRYAALAYQRMQQEWPWLGVGFYWFFKQADDHERASNPQYYFRMVEPDFTPLPVYEAIKAQAQQPPRLYPGWRQANHWAVIYQGQWQPARYESATFGDALAGQPGATAAFTFEGNTLDVVTIGSGQLRFQIDQSPPFEVTLPDTSSPTTTPLVRAWLAGPHQVKLEVIAGPVLIDGYIVKNDPSPLLMGGGVLLTGVVGGIFWLKRRPRWLPLSFILLLATLLRFYRLAGQSLWADEGNSVALARRSFAEIVQHTAFDIHPPLYYWLLKIWITIFGDSEVGLRSLSAVLGIILVYIIYMTGARLFNRRVGLIAAWIAALSPLQVYYAQEARMYMLLAVLSSLTILAALFVLEHCASKKDYVLRLIFYVLVVTAGLYTHYAYPLILVVVNVTALVGVWPTINNKLQIANYKLQITNYKFKIIHWFILQLIPLVFYLPWLPIAWRQITTWPAEKNIISLYEKINQIVITLLLDLSWPFASGLPVIIGLGLVGVLLPLMYLSRGSAHRGSCIALLLLYLWLLLPITLTLVIFSPAFLKFLLVAAPPLALLLALFSESLLITPYSLWQNLHRNTNYNLPHLSGYLLGGVFLVTVGSLSVVSLYHYYTNPVYARDNYRAIVNFIKAVAGPRDAVILNAEGQQDVFNYYYQGAPAPVYPLPRQRPLNETATLTELQTIAGQSNKIYTVYWASQQADPNGVIENWLNTRLFKATDLWYGNVRLVSYASPQSGFSAHITPVDYRLGPSIRLTGYALSPTQLVPGDIAQLTLVWQTQAPLPENYTVFAQILDPANHLVGQRDAPPLTPAPNWAINQPISDTHGIFIEPGTPPGQHRLILGLYNRQTGQRLPVGQGDAAKTQDFIELTRVEIINRNPPLPPEAFAIPMPLNAPLGEVTLVGYDLYKLGHRFDRDAPLHPNDPVQVVAYWTLNQPVLLATGPLTLAIVAENGAATPLTFTYPLAGVDYPSKKWTPGEIVRAQYDFFLSNLKPGTYRLTLSLPANDSGAQPVITTHPFRVE